MEKMIATPLFLPAETKTRLTTEAKRYGVELSPYLRQIIMELLEAAEKYGMPLSTYVKFLVVDRVTLPKSEE